MATVRRIVQVLGVRRGPGAGLAVMLVAVSIGLAAGHVGYRLGGWPTPSGFGLAREWGYGQVFFAVETVWVVGILAYVAWQRKRFLPLAWAGAFAVLLVDDRFTLHEEIGWQLSANVDLVPTTAVGEAIWLGSLGAVVAALMLVAHLRARLEEQEVSVVLILLTAALFVCGVVLDLLHSLVGDQAAKVVMTAVEDGGELVVMSLVVSFLFAVAWCGHQPALGARLAGVARLRWVATAR